MKLKQEINRDELYRCIDYLCSKAKVGESIPMPQKQLMIISAVIEFYYVGGVTPVIIDWIGKTFKILFELEKKDFDFEK